MALLRYTEDFRMTLLSHPTSKHLNFMTQAHYVYSEAQTIILQIALTISFLFMMELNICLLLQSNLDIMDGIGTKMIAIKVEI